MRRILSIALIMLLVLRGLLGDAMAMGVAPVHSAPQAATPQQAAGHGTDRHRHDGAPDHAAPAQDCCDHSGAGHVAHQADCNACGICHTMLGVPAWVTDPETAQRHAERPPHGAAFASAQAAQAIKPPIA